MSDPVTNVEIEDILSSIRRLVSDDPKGGHKPVRAANVGRLVLSPDLRATDTIEEEQSNNAKASPSKPNRGDGGQPDRGPILLSNPELQNVTSVQDAEASPELKTWVTAEELSDFDHGTLAPKLDDKPEVDDDEANQGEADSAYSEEELNAALEAALGDEALAAAAAGEPIVDGLFDPEEGTASESEASEVSKSQGKMIAQLVAETMNDRPHDPLGDDLGTIETVGAYDVGGDAAAPVLGEVDHSNQGDLKDKIAAIEALISRRGPQASPTMPEDEGNIASEAEQDIQSQIEEQLASNKPLLKLVPRENFDTEPTVVTAKEERSSDHRASADLQSHEEVLEWEDEAEFEANPKDHLSEKYAEVSPEGPSGATFFGADVSDTEFGSDTGSSTQSADLPGEIEQDEAEMELDEEYLEQVVSGIVRRELQGVLGERITRNVRKLVRREIHRAMMTQGMD